MVTLNNASPAAVISFWIGVTVIVGSAAAVTIVAVIKNSRNTRNTDSTLYIVHRTVSHLNDDSAKRTLLFKAFVFSTPERRRNIYILSSFNTLHKTRKKRW